MNPSPDSPHIVPVKTYLLIFAALLILLGATIGAAYVDLGRLNLAVAMAISAAKTALVILFFMHIRYENKLTGVVACAGFLWLAILLSLAMGDYVSRHW